MSDTGDKAPWSAACAAIQTGAVQAAVAAVADQPDLMVFEVNVEFSELVVFDTKGAVLMDTVDPKSTPVKVTTKYVADLRPKVGDPKP